MSKTLREILITHLGIDDDEIPAMEPRILAWHRAALTQYGEQVREAIYQRLFDRDYTDHMQNPLTVVRETALPPIEEGES
jgi:hypothetical protein